MPIPPAVIVPELVMPPRKVTPAPPASASMPSPLTEIVPLLLTEPLMVLALENRIPLGPPGVMVPALMTLPLTVALLKVTQAIVCPLGLVKLATAPGPTVFAQAANAGCMPPPMSSAATDDDVSSRQSVADRSGLPLTRPPAESAYVRAPESTDAP
jgi:hypothetical protein